MVATILIFFGGTGLSGYLYAKIVVVAFTFNYLSHALMDRIPVRGIHMDGIADRCMVIGKHNTASVCNPINKSQIVAGSTVGNSSYIPGKPYCGIVVRTLTNRRPNRIFG